MVFRIGIFIHFTCSFVPGIIDFVDSTHRQTAEKGQHLFLFGSPELFKTHAKILESSSQNFGISHITCLLSLIGNVGVTAITNELMQHTEKLIRHFMVNYLSAIYQKLPLV